MDLSYSVSQTAAHLFRHESGKMTAVLVKLFGLSQVEIAEDIVQETLISAMEDWKLHGIPENPSAWLYRVAKNKTIDFLRRERNFKNVIVPNISAALAENQPKNAWLDDLFLENEIKDGVLRMMFACCHPEIQVEQQMALILRTLCGLTAKEIAAAFLQSEDTIGKRIFRAKDKIRQAKLSLVTPSGSDLLVRIDAVLQTIYLLFNEGYKSSSETSVIRRDLCSEAIRLCVILVENPISNLPQTHALLALMCFQAARFEARLDVNGEIVLLENQDRTLWNKHLIGLGYQHFSQANTGQQISQYHLQAAIASYHTTAANFAATNWQAIFYCYDLLLNLKPSPVVALNRAIALGYATDATKAIEALLNIKGLEQNYLYHTALGDFYKRNQQPQAASTAYQAALKFVHLPAEQLILKRKIADL